MSGIQAQDNLLKNVCCTEKDLKSFRPSIQSSIDSPLLIVIHVFLVSICYLIIFFLLVTYLLIMYRYCMEKIHVDYSGSFVWPSTEMSIMQVDKIINVNKKLYHRLICILMW